MTDKQTFKQRVISLIMLLALFFGALQPTTVLANANGSGDIGDMEVTISDNGKLTITGNSGMTTGVSSGTAWTNFIKKYRNFIVGIAGIGAVSMILFFIFQLLKLGSTAGNPQARTQALTGLIWSGVAAAALGSVTIIVGFFYSAFR